MDISTISTPATPRNVADAIQGAARATGTSFEYLLATAQVESGLNPQAASTTSTARGLYQIIDQTWLATMKRSGPSLGYAKYADAIVQTTPGHYEVPDPAMRQEIMGLRDNPVANAAIAGALTQDNAAMLAGRLGRQASDGELYIAHFLGPAGAAKLTGLAATNPAVAADAVFPAAAEANHAIFYDRQGHGRSVAEVYGTLVGRYDNARNPTRQPFNVTVANAAMAAPPTLPPNPTRAPDPGAGAAVLANMSPLAVPASGPLFQGLFSDGGGAAGPLAPNLPVPPSRIAALPGQVAAPAAPSSQAAAGLFQSPSTNASGLFGR